MTEASTRPVVIGVDGSAGSRQALLWGLDLAHRRGVSVRLLHAINPGFHDVMIEGGPLPTPRRERQLGAKHLLEEELAFAQERWPGLPITTELAPDSGAGALIAESERAQAVVVGAHGVSAFSTLLAGSTTMNLAAHAHCPVVAVPSKATHGTGIVVGVDGTGLSDAAVDWAFREAADTGEPLTAVLAWTDPVVPHVIAAALPVEDDPIEAPRGPDAVLGAALVPATTAYPQVVVHRRVVRNPAALALTTAAAGARLLVVGCRGAGTARSMLLGSVSHGVLHLSTCPVAVVPHHG